MTDWKDVDLDNCPVVGALDVIGDRWSLLILRETMNGVTRFDDLVDHIGIGRSTLSDRIKKLVGAGVLTPRPYQEAGARPRTEYVLTEKGWDLRNVVIALKEWGDRHVLEPDDRPLVVIDSSTGSPVKLALVDDDGNVAEDRRLRHVPGPGFRTRAVTPTSPDSTASHR